MTPELIKYALFCLGMFACTLGTYFAYKVWHLQGIIDKQDEEIDELRERLKDK